MRKPILWAVGAMVLSGVILSTAVARADEILDQINEAIGMYKAGDYAGAVGGLDFAAQQIRQLQADRVSEALPDPLPGWAAEESETSAMSAAMFGGGISAEREYTKGDASVEIRIVGEAPMLQAVMMMFNNPMMMSGSGRKLTRIKGLKAMVEYDKEERSGETTLLVQNSVLVTVSGSNVGEDDIKAYAEVIDYKLIESVVSGN